MTASQTSIVNWALTKLGSDRITNPGDANERAETAAEIYPQVLDAELRRNAWKFAIKSAALGEELPAPALPWTRRFALPGDCLRLLVVGSDPMRGQAWAIEGRHIVGNQAAPLPIRYVTSAVTPAIMDALFVEALATKLAIDLAPRLRDDEQTYRRLKLDYRDAVAEARRIGSIELPPMARSDADPWVESRVAGPWIATGASV